MIEICTLRRATKHNKSSPSMLCWNEWARRQLRPVIDMCWAGKKVPSRKRLIEAGNNGNVAKCRVNSVVCEGV